ncbi:MAG: hypothetical protein ACLFR2_10405 [Candidatus Kapaibacterium sp.]
METSLERVLTTSYKEDMISYMKAHPSEFREALELALSDKQPYSWRSAWLLWSCMEENDPRFRKHITDILDSIKGKKDGHQRELLKILLNMELDEDREGILFNLCLDLWEKTDKRPSVRVTAFKGILKVVSKHPDLAREMAFLTQDHYLETLSPGVKRSVIKMMISLEA